MFAKSKIVRLGCCACLAATWLPLGNGLMQSAQALPPEVVRGGPIVEGAPSVRIEPIVTVAPLVRVAPIRVEPFCYAPIVREPIVREPIVRVGEPVIRERCPIVPGGPIVHCGPVYPHPWCHGYEHLGWGGVHWRR